MTTGFQQWRAQFVDQHHGMEPSAADAWNATKPPQDERGQGLDMDTMQAIYAKAWSRAADWANRHDLHSDVGSPEYLRDMAIDIAEFADVAIAASAPAQQAGQRKTLESMAAEAAIEQDPELSTPPQPMDSGLSAQAINDILSAVPDIGDKAAREWSIARAVERALRATAEPLTDTYVQRVPDKCDRIIWRNAYYDLPLKVPHPVAAGVVTDAAWAIIEAWDRNPEHFVVDIKWLSPMNKAIVSLRAALSGTGSDESAKEAK